jgi:MerR family transcriptional regulator, light-induced transcriptional regulator
MTLKRVRCDKSILPGRVLLSAKGVPMSNDSESLRFTRPDFDAGRDWAPKVATGRRVARADAQSSLAGIVEAEIVPRLYLAHRAGSRTLGAPRLPAAEADGRAFAERALEMEAGDLIAHTLALVERGLAADAVFLELLAPAARRLGEMWEEDACTFVEVTTGLSRLHQTLRAVSAQLAPPRVQTSPAGRILLVPGPGEQHVFGLAILEEMFRREGWEAECDLIAGVAQIHRLIDVFEPDVIGFSVSRLEGIGPLTALIKDIRKKAGTGCPAILVGGKVFSDTPALAASVGADKTAANGPDALKAAFSLVRAGEFCHERAPR